MPLMNSTGALKIQRPSTTLTYANWMSANGNTGGSIVMYDYLKKYNDDVYIAYLQSFNGINWIQLDGNSGIPTYYTHLTPPAAPGNGLISSTVDGSGNIHVLAETNLYMYSSSKTLIRAVSLSTAAGEFVNTARVYNNAGYVYIIRPYSSSFRITKIQISDYSIVWSTIYTTGLNNFELYNILFLSGGDLIVVGGGNAGKTFFYVRLTTSGGIVWQKKRSFVTTTSTGPGSKSVLDSSDYLYVMSNVVVSGTNFTNILYKIDTSTGNKVDERTLSTTSDAYYTMQISGTYLYLATIGAGIPGPNIIVTVIDTSFNAIQNHNINDTNGMTIGGIAVTSTNCYVSLNLGSPNNIPVVLKLPLDTDLTTVSHYNIPTAFSGTLTITKIADVTFTATSTIVLSTATITTSSETMTATAIGDDRNAITPIKYIKSI